MKKILNSKFVIPSIFLAIIAVGGLSIYLFTPEREISIHADHKLFNSANELEEYADLIVVGETVAEFSEHKPTITYTPEGRYQDFYTITDVKYSKILKGNFSEKFISVIQGAALIESPYKLQKDLLLREDMTLMEKGKKYLLFLKKTDIAGVYSIISLNQGKFNIDNLDLKEKDMEKQNHQFKTLKQDVLNKFNKKF